jgi:hypothetical protein
VFDQVSTKFEFGGGYTKELERAAGIQELFSTEEDTSVVTIISGYVQVEEDGSIIVLPVEDKDIFG